MTARGRFEVIELSICSDCAQLTANGDLGGVGDVDAHAARMEAHLGDNVRHLVISCTGDDGDYPHDAFSSRPCDACGSDLAGERCPAALLIPRTMVVFRMWRNVAACGHRPIALFPADPWDSTGALCASYEHHGQHGGADYAGVIARTRPATPEEYAPLARELEGIGYTLDIRQRRPARRDGGAA